MTSPIAKRYGISRSTGWFRSLFADSAYTGEGLHEKLIAKEVELRIHEKGYKNNPLNEEQKATNKAKSSFRVRVEHVFGFMPA